MSKTKTALNDLSTEELETLLKARKQAEREAAQAAKIEYERRRNELINLLGTSAVEIYAGLGALKNEALSRLRDFRGTMLEYGDLRGGENNKGNYQLENEHFKITFTSHVRKTFDERSLLAEEHLKNFLNGFVKKRDRKLHKFIMGLMERDSKTGELDIDNINRLYAMEDDFDDPEWKEAIKLFKESYNPTGTAEYVRFYKRNESGAWELVNLNFSSI